LSWLLGTNKNSVPRIFQIKIWQIRERPVGVRPHIEAALSISEGKKMAILCFPYPLGWRDEVRQRHG
jgi:hypothetical protein